MWDAAGDWGWIGQVTIDAHSMGSPGEERVDPVGDLIQPVACHFGYETSVGDLIKGLLEIHVDIVYFVACCVE